MQPPRLAAIAHGKLSNRQYFKFRRVQTKHHSHQAIPFSRRNVPARWVRPLASCRSIDAYFSGSKPTLGTAFTRNFDKDPSYPYRYGFQTDNRLEGSPTR